MNGPFILKHNLLLAMFYILKNPIAVLILIVLSTFLDSSKARTVLKVEFKLVVEIVQLLCNWVNLNILVVELLRKFDNKNIVGDTEFKQLFFQNKHDFWPM